MNEVPFTQNCQRIYAEINLDALRNNMECIKNRLDGKTGIIAVVKTDAYGHGALPIAREIENLDGLSGFAVATDEEAFFLRRKGIRKPVLVLGYVFPGSYEQMIEDEIRITVFRDDTLKELSAVSTQKKSPKKAKVHIKVDTGMNRIGIRPDEEGIAFVEQAFRTSGIEVEGIFTHFARADETDKSSALEQLHIFQDFLERIRERTGRDIPIKHCSNSAGILELPQAGMDAVRAGIILYGLWPSDQVSRRSAALIPVMSLYSRIIYIKEIRPGDAVSYGGCFVAEDRMRIATIPAGYGDGYPRSLSGCGYVLIHGKKAPVLGRICMDQFMVDVTDIPDAAEGDRVTLLGQDGQEEITLEQLGALSGRFNYEFACCIGKRVPRVVLKGGRIAGIYDSAGECLPFGDI